MLKKDATKESPGTFKCIELFKREIEFIKQSVGKRNNMNFSYSELLEIGKEIIEMFK